MGVWACEARGKGMCLPTARVLHTPGAHDLGDGMCLRVGGGQWPATAIDVWGVGMHSLATYDEWLGQECVVHLVGLTVEESLFASMVLTILQLALASGEILLSPLLKSLQSRLSPLSCHHLLP